MDFVYFGGDDDGIDDLQKAKWRSWRFRESFLWVILMCVGKNMEGASRPSHFAQKPLEYLKT